jgi:hypothetical protein
MPASEPLDYLPLWGVCVATFGLLLLSAEAGFLLGRRNRRRSEEAQKAPVGEVVAAMLGLLALLLGFTFSLAASRFDTRRGLVLDEANALGTTWLRAGLLPEAQRTESRQLLRQYLEVRLEVVKPGRVLSVIDRSEQLQERLWAEAAALGEQQTGSIMAGLYIASLNELIDLHAKRVSYGLRVRIAPIIWAALYLVAVLAFGAMGYHGGVAGARQFLAILPLVLTFAAVLLMIADLDRPQEGLFRVSQQSLVDLRKLMGGGSP